MAQWRLNDAQWYEEKMLFCATSGRMIAKHYLSASFADGAKTFCSEACLELFRDYWLGERGSDHRPPPNIGEMYADLMVK